MIFHDLKAYKLSQVYLKDLLYLITEIELEIEKINKYNKYTSVKRILNVMNEELDSMRANRDKCRRLISTKGQIREE